MVAAGSARFGESDMHIALRRDQVGRHRLDQESTRIRVAWDSLDDDS
jgi:hypothetical protein